MTWWQYILAAIIIGFWILMVFIGIFEWLALREQNEPKEMDLHEYNRQKEAGAWRRLHTKRAAG
jgi:hypothetical protein